MSTKETSKKNNRFGSSFKGLVKRKSKKSKSTGASSTASRSSAATNDPRDDSTVYSVAFDASTNASTPASSAPTDNASAKTPLGEPLHVILLMMDPLTRRFELLQLEFDSATAKVSDITDQIPLAATEPSLTSQKFESLTTLKGDELISSKPIAEYIDSAGIIVAVPTTTIEKGGAVAKMANPILTNPKVHSMLVKSGLEIPDLPSPIFNAPEQISPSEEKKGETDDEISPPPLQEDVEPQETSKKTRDIALDFPVGDDLFPEEDVVEDDVPAPEPVKKEPSFLITSIPAIPFYLAFLFLCAQLISQVNEHFTSPLGIGDTLAPGRSRGLCGMTILREKPCHGATILMDDEGVLSVIDETAGDIVYQLTGKSECDASNPSCVEGMTIDSKGKIFINGSKPKVSVKRKVDKLKPWPFTEEVTVPRFAGLKKELGDLVSTKKIAK